MNVLLKVKEVKVIELDNKCELYGELRCLINLFE